MQQYFRFLIVGSIGFVLDAGLLFLLIQFGFSPVLARIPAISTAVIVTWLLNRQLTFRVDAPKSHAEALRYIVVAAVSALLNFAVYTVLIIAGIWPVLAVAISSIALLFFSFHFYKRFAFKLMSTNKTGYLTLPGDLLNTLRGHVVFIIGIMLACVLLIRGINQSWVGTGDSDGALFGSIARNYLQFGLFELKLGQLVTFEEINQVSGDYYLHHPPLFPMLVSLLFYYFGESEAAVRSVSVLATLATGAVLFLLVKKAADTRLALLSLFFFSTYPSTIFFGRKPGYEALTLFFLVLAVFLYQKYKNNPKKSTLVYLCSSLAAGAASDWAAYFLPIAFFVDQLRTINQRKFNWHLLIGVFMAPAIVLIVFIVSIYLVNKDSLLNLIHQGLAYTGLIKAGSEIAKTVIEANIEFSIKEYIFRLIKNFNTDFGIISIMLAMLGMAFVNKNKAIKHIAIMLLVVALCPLVIFWRSLYFHIWWLHLLTIPLAIFSAVAVAYIIALVEKDSLCDINKIKQGVVMAICFPVLVSTSFNLWELSHWQERLLPAGVYESPNFIRLLGERIYDATALGDQILTNLPVSEKMLPYYSRRIITANLTLPEHIEKWLTPKNTLSNSHVYFLLAVTTTTNPIEQLLHRWLKNHEVATAFIIDKNQFYLYKLN